MTTKSDRNLPLDRTPEYLEAAAAIRPQGERKADRAKAHDEYDKRMNEYMSTRKSLDDATAEEWHNASLSATAQYVRDEDYMEIKERSLRHNSGKPDYSLIPMAAMKEAAHVLEYGATKYAIDNWMKPTDWRVSYACLMRHMSAWQSGEDLDPESGRNHLGHAMCNILQMLYMLENHPEELER